MLSRAKLILAYIKARLDERSTLTAIVAAIGAAAIIPAPWCYFSFAVGAVAALMPDGSVRG